MIPFIRNNIEFRQVSSQALSGFFASKSFMLGEIACKTKHPFSKTAKEILLQSFKIWTDWLFALEEICVETKNGIFDEQSLTQALHLANLKNQELRDLFEANPEDFDPKFVDTWIAVQAERRPLSRHQLKTALLGRKISTSYNEASLWLVTYMHHLMFNLHEIDYLLYSGNKCFPFIYLDEADVNFYMSDRVTFDYKRISVYAKQGILKEGNILIKDVTSKEPVNIERELAVSSMLTELKSQGISYTLNQNT